MWGCISCGSGRDRGGDGPAHDRVRRSGGSTHLFSFFPSPVPAWPAIPSLRWGNIEGRSCRYLIDEELARAEQFSFNQNGQLVSFGLPQERLDEILHGESPS